MLRTLFIATFLGALTLFYFRDRNASILSPMTTTSWSSPFSGWHDRAIRNPHPSPHSFAPARQALLLAVLLHAPVEHEGITLTLYDNPKGETVAIDARGRVILVSERDVAGMLALAGKVSQLPESEQYRNPWVVQRETTSQPVHRLFIQSQEPDKHLKEVGIQGFSKETRVLKIPVEGYRELPDSLWELGGLVLEARDGSETGSDDVVLGKVREVVKDLF